MCVSSCQGLEGLADASPLPGGAARRRRAGPACCVRAPSRPPWRCVVVHVCLAVPCKLHTTAEPPPALGLVCARGVGVAAHARWPSECGVYRALRRCDTLLTRRGALSPLPPAARCAAACVAALQGCRVLTHPVLLPPQTFEANSWVWVTDPKDMFLPAKVVKSFKPGEEGTVKFEDGKVRPAPAPSSRPLRGASRAHAPPPCSRRRCRPSRQKTSS